MLDSARALLENLLALARTRLELAGSEVEARLARLAAATLCALAVLLLAALGLAFAGAAVLIAAGEEHRVAAASGFGVTFLVLAAAGAWQLRRTARAHPPLFAHSIAELRRDCDELRQAAAESLSPLAGGLSLAGRLSGWAGSALAVYALLRKGRSRAG